MKPRRRLQGPDPGLQDPAAPQPGRLHRRPPPDHQGPLERRLPAAGRPGGELHPAEPVLRLLFGEHGPAARRGRHLRRRQRPAPGPEAESAPRTGKLGVRANQPTFNATLHPLQDQVRQPAAVLRLDRAGHHDDRDLLPERRAGGGARGRVERPVRSRASWAASSISTPTSPTTSRSSKTATAIRN